MTIAHVKLPGLDGERVLAAVTPILAAHRVDGVELVFKTDRSGWVLELTLEKIGERVPGAGISEYTIIGALHGLSPEKRVLIQSERGELIELSLDEIDNSHLVFDWKSGGSRSGGAGARRPHGREQRSARRR